MLFLSLAIETIMNRAAYMSYQMLHYTMVRQQSLTNHWHNNSQ